MPCKHRWTMTPNLYWTRWGMSNQCCWEWSRHVKPRSNFRVQWRHELPRSSRAEACHRPTEFTAETADWC